MRHESPRPPFLWLYIMGGLAIFSTTMSKNPVLPLFIKGLGVGEGTVGFIAAASTVVGVLVSLPAGLLSDLLGRRRMIMLSMIVFASAPFLYLLVRTPCHLVLVRIYHGTATAILGPVALAIVADASSARRGERMAWYSSATMVGRLLAPTLGGLLIVGQDFRRVYLGCGIGGTLALLAALRLPRLAVIPKVGGRGTMRTYLAKAGNELRVVLASRGMLLTSLVEAAQYFAFGAVETFLPLYLHRLGYAARQIGLLFTIQIVVLTLTKPLMGWLSDRWSQKGLILLGLLAGSATLAIMPHISSYWLLLGLMGVFGLEMAAVTASTSALISNLARSSAYGTSLGMLSSIMDIGHSTGPMLTGLLVQAHGYTLAFSTVAGILISSALSFCALAHVPIRPRKGDCGENV